MRLLVSVANAAEASAALLGGADIIDAKDPLSGSLGPVSIDVLREIYVTCAGARPVTAALGDASDEAEIERSARAFSRAGATLVKVGFAGIASAERVESLIAAAVRGAAGTVGLEPFSRWRGAGPSRLRLAWARLAVAQSAEAPAPAAPSSRTLKRARYAHLQRGVKPDTTYNGGVIAVAYADAERVGSLAPAALVDLAARAHAKGVLLDTADKSGPGLRRLLGASALAAWVAAAHGAGLLVALAGKLTADDLSFARDAGADVAGVRGAACDDGRTGRVVTDKVRVLRARCDSVTSDPHGPPEGGHYVHLRT